MESRSPQPQEKSPVIHVKTTCFGIRTHRNGEKLERPESLPGYTVEYTQVLRTPIMSTLMSKEELEVPIMVSDVMTDNGVALPDGSVEETEN